MTFLPLMALMFLLLAVLEDSGYLARAAVVTDRMMRSIGLPGRAFLPLLFRELLPPQYASGLGSGLASILIYLLMAAVLFWKPQGLFPARG